MLWVIGVERYPDRATIQKIDIDLGIYRMPHYIKGSNYEDIANEVVLQVIHKRPSRIIFDEYGDGLKFRSQVIKKLLLIRIEINEVGEVTGYISQE
ncbi:hypothetical protein G9G63_09095 [Paenibacillus sp. EKM202P]|uniref:hypothetical protein n=1 Tax=unclassified Paenibacillus TaxID=185978 RepID=UPI0013ECEA95|nr:MULTISPECIES: hypothetical protein [unclassified Paenibacillus]KAF6565305.1 hypothetical protein G9G63_09095 [Paenibacillus sp. EKM202P]KAF6569369.1 hypothetical protein G9G64_12995 [Paenibacillus sp. EKM207P]